ncbi:GTP cyclohydrolase IIa [Haladaptatus paucihalophilus DX253]|uniref:GTP cyclohydrolase III n=1 Tax=Haladaptatus paucihalophilus DX253 TaxID=797209 RepID=E7QQ07_HALPU|nr:MULTISPECIES: GTP cyclohydrolase III [Haladaptatus]EFW93071.1 GTP cyclohydrolase IIa [Haladaptatus paucihalophilus DX253]GKZ12470.1 GTP cyclohydrolase IIa [Haladaptatus sp. T7]SHK43759.1 GTP cyclohydrolase IIa [Haladaptatus paucihalophilus DX253]
MTNAQITLIQIDNYGPWTVTPEPRREVDLQTLQSRLYADLSQLIGNREGYVFFTRFDNMVAVTNGLSLDDHALVQESVGNRYPVTVSLSVATGTNPVQALHDATELLQDAGSAQDHSRREILDGRTIDEEFRTDDDVQIAHFDVNDMTGNYTDEVNAFDSFIHIEQGYAELMRYMREAHDSLSFFVGGDNVIAVCPNLTESDYEDAIRHVKESVEVDLKVGVGQGRVPQDAGMDAKHALETCRATGSKIEFE